MTMCFFCLHKVRIAMRYGKQYDFFSKLFSRMSMHVHVQYVDTTWLCGHVQICTGTDTCCPVVYFIDVDTRRRAACDLVQALCKSFEGPVIQNFSQYVQGLLQV